MSAFEENRSDSTTSSDDDVGGGPSLGLSEAALAALREFALDRGISSGEDDNILDQVRDHFEVKDRSEIFDVSFESSDGARNIEFSCKGVKRELGQTLSSTGLTIWRAAEHLCEFAVDNPERFASRRVCELGCGLGMVSILLAKLDVCKAIVATDGDDDTVELLQSNINNCGCDDAVDACKLFWGENALFLNVYPEKFDTVIAADVIYEEEQVQPLIDTVADILRRKVDGTTDGTAPPPEFLLAFARRNVPIDKVFQTAQEIGLQWEVLDAGPSGLEPIYRFVWK